MFRRTNNELQESMNKQCSEGGFGTSLKHKSAKNNKELLDKNEKLEQEFEKLECEHYELTTKLKESEFENINKTMK